MALLYDKYVPQEGFNTIFSDVENCEIVSRPSEEGFYHPLFFLKNRKGLETDASRWSTIGNIVSSIEFNNKQYLYTDAGYVYTFDGTSLDMVITLPESISSSVSTYNFLMGPIGTIGYSQEFTLANEASIRKVVVKLKRESISFPGGSTTAAAYVKCSIGSSLSYTTISYNQLTDAYQEFQFYFSGLELGAGMHSFSILSYGDLEIAELIGLGGSATNNYVGHKLSSQPDRVDTGGTAWFLVEATGGLAIDQNNYDATITKVSYLGGGRYPNATTEYTVSAYNSTTGEVTFTETTLGSAFVGKYMYVKSGGTGKYQRRYISASSANNKLTPSSVFTISLAAGDKVIIYNSLEQQIWFPQLRKSLLSPNSDYMYTLDISGNSDYRYYPNKRSFVNWDNRIAQLTNDRQAIIFSSDIDFEIPILTSVSFGNAKALSIDIYGGYLMVFFENKVGLIKKDIIDATAGTFAYIYQDLLDVGLFSKKSYLIQGGSLYIFGEDKRLYSVDLSVVGLGDIQGKMEDQGSILVNYFNLFNGGDVILAYDQGTIMVIYRGSDGKSSVYKYYTSFKSWIVDRYPFSGNFFGSLYSVLDNKYTWSSNSIVKFGGRTDLGQKITQKIKMYGPVQGIFDQFVLILMKIRLGFMGYKLGGRIEMSIGGSKKYTKSWDIESIDPIRSINNTILADGTVGTSGLGGDVVGGSDIDASISESVFSEIQDISIRIGKRGTNYSITMINDTGNDMPIGGIIPYYNQANPLVTYNKSVLK